MALQKSEDCYGASKGFVIRTLESPSLGSVYGRSENCEADLLALQTDKAYF